MTRDQAIEFHSSGLYNIWVKITLVDGTSHEGLLWVGSVESNQIWFEPDNDPDQGFHINLVWIQSIEKI